MLKELKFALYAIKKNLENSAELRSSFLMNVFGMALNNIAFIFLWVFFVKSVGVVGGWTAYDIVGLQGFITFSGGFILSAGAGIRRLPEYVSTGAFDRFMLSPKNLLVRIATAYFNPSAVGDMLFGLICLIIYGFLINISVLQVLLLIILLILSTIIFLAGVISIFSISFFFVDAQSVVTGFFELFLTPGIFHGGAFQGAMRFIFIFIIPSLLLGTLPIEIIRHLSINNLCLMIILAIIWLFISIKFFFWAVKKYESANFMTFGS